MSRKIDYNARNFAEVRSELVGFVKQYYPDIFNDFNDASVGMMLLELNADYLHIYYKFLLKHLSQTS